MKKHQFEKQLPVFDEALRKLVTVTPQAVKSADETWHKDRKEAVKKKSKRKK